LIAFAAILLAFSSIAAAADAPRATSLDDLLRQVQQGDTAERREHEQRETEFRAAQGRQRQLLEQALAEKAVAEARSNELELRFEKNEAEIPQLQETLRSRQGTLGELFGVVRQVAGDTRGIIESSVISAQLPGREEFLSQLAQSREMPSIEDLEKLWFILQEHMTEAGKNTRFGATVVTPEGESRQQEVVRIGTFNAFSGGKYLQWLPETRRLTELGRQPGSRHLATLAAYEQAKSGLIGVAIDPSRGSILSLLIQTPGFMERVDQGGLIGYITIVLGLIGLALAAERLVGLAVVGGKIRAQLKSRLADPGNPLGRVLAVYEEHKSADVETLELKLDEAILKETPKLERFNTLIKVISVAAPLLGLLGTVTGMIQTFEVITLFGAGDPKLMAGGISMALVTTVIGLCVAIPLVLLHSVVASRSTALVQILDEQSAGLIAARAEQTDSATNGSHTTADRGHKISERVHGGAAPS
jgi:biopolymer transport protein ExbB